MKSLLDESAPTEIAVTGTRLVGAVAVGYTLTSALTCAIRFGAHMFGQGQIITANGVDYDVCLTVIETEGVWKTDHYDGIRRVRDLDGNYLRKEVPEAASNTIRHWAEEVATRLAFDYPEAFTSYGFSDRADDGQYAPATTLRNTAQKLADDAWLLHSYANIARLVDDGNLTVVPVDGPLVRWKHCESMRNLPGPVDCPQPAKVVGNVVDGDSIIGYAIDARSRSSYRQTPCTNHGPLICPIDHATITDR